MATEKQRALIGHILARALQNTPAHIVAKLNVDDTRNEGVDAIAACMVRELGRDRWQMKGPPRQDNCTLEGFFCSALRSSHCPHLGSQNPDERRRASSEAVVTICATLKSYKVVLVQWRQR